MGLETIALSTLAAAAIGGGAQVYSAKRAEKTAKKSARDQTRAERRAEETEKRRETQTAARIKKRRGATEEGRGRSDVLSLASVGAATGGKTLLGA